MYCIIKLYHNFLNRSPWAPYTLDSFGLFSFYFLPRINPKFTYGSTSFHQKETSCICIRNGSYLNRIPFVWRNSTRELIKISGKINGIQEDMTHIVEHLQGTEETLKINDNAIQRLNNPIDFLY